MHNEHRVHQRCACGSALSSYGGTAGGAADVASSFVLSGTERVYERPRPFRIEHIALDLQIQHARRRLVGSAELTIARVDPDATEIRLDAVAFDVTSVQVNVSRARRGAKKSGRFRSAQVVYDGDVLRVAVPATATAAVVRIRYSANPRRGMYFLEPDEATPERPRQVWTQCQDEDARYIFPCHDKPHIKQSMDIRVKVEPGWFVLSNGDLVSGKAPQKRGEFHYRMKDRQPSYLFTIVAGNFTKIESRVGKLPVDYYVPAGRGRDGKRTFKNTPAMIRLFAKLTGVAYPWTKYAQIVVSDFIFGGMENTGATTMYEHILLDDRAAIDVSSDDLIAHELAHQWFGDLVTCRDWSHAWLNEGFATFMEHIWREHDLGTDEFHHGLSIDLRAYLNEANGRYERPVVCQDYEAPIDIFDRHLYEKGALFLHTLRRELGDAVFWKGVNSYLERFAGGVVETRDLLRCLEEASGQSLEQHFEQGVYRAGHARLDVEITHDDDLLVVSVKQTLKTGEKPYALDLELDIAPAKGRLRRETRQVSKRQHTFAFRMDARPRFVVVDPELRILGRVHVKASTDMLRNQLAGAPSARGRSLAGHALGSRDDPKSIAALNDALRSSRYFWGTRAVAAQALGNIRSPEAQAHLSAASRTRHPKVRRAVAQALGNFRNEEAAKTLARMAKGDASVLVSASAARSLGATRNELAFDTLVELLEQSSWAEVVRAGAIGGLARLRDERGVAVLRDNTKYGVPTRARRAAIASLPTLSHTRKTRELLEELLDESDPHLRVNVTDALGELGDVKARGALRRQLERDLDARVRRRIREVLRDLGGKGRREARRLREELEDLRREHAELKVRLSKIEERVGDKPKRRSKR